MTMFRVILLGALLLLLAVLRVLSVGTRRGSPAYKWRMGVWAAALMLAAAAGMVSVSPPAAGLPALGSDFLDQDLAGNYDVLPPTDQASGEAVVPADSAASEVEPQMMSCYCTVAPTSRW